MVLKYILREQQQRRIPLVNQLRQMPLGPAGRPAGGWVGGELRMRADDLELRVR